jgi:hypothetical protein
MATQDFGVASGGYFNFRGVNFSPYSVGSSVSFSTNRVVQSIGIQIAGAGATYQVRGVLWNSTGSTVLSQSAETNVASDNTAPFTLKTFDIPNYYCPAGTYYVGFWRDSDTRVNWDVQNGSNTSRTSGGSGAGSSADALDSSGTGNEYRRLIGRVTYTDVNVTDAPTFTVSQGYGSAVVTDLEVSDDGTNGVSISPWGISYQSSLNDGAWTAISEGGSITGLTVGQEYNIRIRAINPVGASAASDYDYVTPYGLPIMLDADFDFTPGVGNEIYWDADENYDEEGIDYYHIYRSVNGGTFTYYHQTNATETEGMAYTDSAVSLGNTYAYRVYAHNRAGWSGYAQTGTALAAVEPSQPLNFIASDIGPDYITVTWSAPLSNGGESVDFYNLYLRVGENDFYIDTVDSSDPFEYTIDYIYDDVNDQDIFISPNQTYTILVDAENDVGPGPFAIITVTTIGGVIKYYDPDLEEWVYKPVRVYNGDTETWDSAYVKKYNGISWDYV